MKPQLQRKAEFEAILADYHVSEDARSIIDQITLVLLRAPSAGGRNTIIRELVKTGEYEFIISDTTRPKRENDGVLEQDGVEYWFRSEEDVLNDLKTGQFLEAEIIHDQQVSGISIRELRKAQSHNKISINEVHFVGVDNIIREKPDTHVIFITPPNFEEWIRRFRGRGRMEDAEFEQRFRTAEEDYRHALENNYYRYVVNDNYHAAGDRVRRIVEANEYDAAEEEQARAITEHVYTQIQREIRKN